MSPFSTLYVTCCYLWVQWWEYCFLFNTKLGRWISSEDGSSTQICFWKDVCDRFRATIQGEVVVASLWARDTKIWVWWVQWHGAIWVEEGWYHRWRAKGTRVSQMIEDYEPFEGQPLLDAKCFKWMTPVSPWIKSCIFVCFCCRVFIDAVLTSKQRLSLVFLCLSGGLV